MGITVSVENGLGQDVEVWLSLRSARHHTIKTCVLAKGETVSWTDNGLSASCIYSLWVNPCCPFAGKHIGWWKFPCRAPAVKGEHIYRISHLMDNGLMECKFRDVEAGCVEASEESQWNPELNARVIVPESFEIEPPVEGWLKPFEGSLAEAFEAYDSLPDSDWAKDIFSSLSDMHSRGACLDAGIAAEVAGVSGLSALELFTAMFGPHGDMLQRYHQRIRNVDMHCGLYVGSRSGRVDPDATENGSLCSRAGSQDIDADADADTGAPSSSPSRSEKLCRPQVPQDSLAPLDESAEMSPSSAADGAPPLPRWQNWCGTGYLTCKVESPSGPKPYDEQLRFVACRTDDEEVVALQSSGQVSGFPGARMFRAETLYIFSQRHGEREVNLRGFALVTFVSNTLLRGVIEPRIWEGVKKSYGPFLQEVQNTSAGLCTIVTPARSTTPHGNVSVVAGSVHSSRPSRVRWWWRPVIAPAHVVLALPVIFVSRALISRFLAKGRPYGDVVEM